MNVSFVVTKKIVAYEKNIYTLIICSIWTDKG